MARFVAIHKGVNIGSVEFEPIGFSAARSRLLKRNLPPSEITPTSEELAKIKEFLIAFHEARNRNKPTVKYFRRGEHFPEDENGRD